MIVLFFLSGTAGLIYQIVWTRELVLVFGNTMLAASTVLSSFMGGLAAGSFVWFGHEGDGILEPGEDPRVEEQDAVDALIRLFRTGDDHHPYRRR